MAREKIITKTVIVLKDDNTLEGAYDIQPSGVLVEVSDLHKVWVPFENIVRVDTYYAYSYPEEKEES